MHEGYWGFIEPPFSQSPDPRFYYMSEAHQEAIMMLHYGLVRNKGGALVTGSVGHGKTMLCHKLMSLMDQASTHVISVAGQDFKETVFTLEVLTGLGIEAQGNQADQLAALRSKLSEQSERDKKTVLFIDDAHQLEDPNAWEELKSLLDIQSEDRFLINIVLAGLPSLAERLSKNAALDELFGVREKLHPLDLEDTRDLVRHRLRCAGIMGESGPITSEGVVELHHHTKGVPRLICQLADHALLLGMRNKAKHVDADLVRESAYALYGHTIEDAA
jgi:general secretion pathway protein A